MISTQIRVDKKYRIIAGAIHTKSENTLIKWEKLKEQLYLSKKAYKDP